MGMERFITAKNLLLYLLAGLASMALASPAFSDGGEPKSSGAGRSASAHVAASATIVQPPGDSCDRALNSLSVNTRSLGGEDRHSYGPLMLKCYMKDGRQQIDLIVGDNNNARSIEATGITDIPLSAMAEPAQHLKVANHRPASGPPYQQRIIEFIYNYE